MSSVSERIAELLKKDKRFTQKGLHEATGIPASTINRWVKDGSSIDSEYIIPISEYFGVSAEYLLGTSDRVFIGHSDEQFIFYFPEEAPPLNDVARRRGISLEELHKKTGISLNALQNCYEKYVPTYKELSVLASALNTSTDFLLGRTDEIDPPNKEERTLIKYYRGLSEIDQHLLLGKAAELIKNANDESVAADPAEAPAKMAK